MSVSVVLACGLWLWMRLRRTLEGL